VSKSWPNTVNAPPIAQRRGDRQRDKMGFRLVRLSNETARIRAGGVEVAQGDGAKPVGPALGGDHPLGGQFGVAVGTDRRLGVALHDRGLRAAITQPIDRGAGREHQPPDAAFAHDGQERRRAGDIDVPEDVRPLRRASDLDQAGEVDHRLDLVRLDRLTQGRGVADVAMHEGAPLDRFPEAGIEVVENHRRVAPFAQGLGGVRADIAGPAGDQHRPASRLQS
jgi:hypothetical protein